MPMTSQFLPTSSVRGVRLALLCGIPMLVLAYFVVPFFGAALSLAIPITTHAARRQLWRNTSSTSSAAWSWLAWVGLWWPGVLTLFGPFQATEEGGGIDVATAWLVMPLCGPASLSGILLPAVAASVTALGGLLGVLMTRRPWPWVAALWLAPWIYHGVFSLIDPPWLC